MKSAFLKCKIVLNWAILCTVIGFMTISNAHAITLFGAGFGLVCGTVNTEPSPVPTADGTRFVTVSATTTVLKGMVEGKNKLRHFAVVKSVRPDSSVAWTRSITTQSLAIATVIPSVPPAYFITEALNIPDRNASPVLVFPGECLGVSLAEHNGMERIIVALGTSAASGGTIPVAATEGSSNPDTQAVVKGKDKSVVNFWVFDPSNGNIVRTFRPRAKPGRYFLAFSSGVFDIDDDGNSELVLVYARFVGEDRYDFIYESYNIATGALKNTTTTIQNNKVFFQP